MNRRGSGRAPILRLTNSKQGVCAGLGLASRPESFRCKKPLVCYWPVSRTQPAPRGNRCVWPRGRYAAFSTIWPKPTRAHCWDIIVVCGRRLEESALFCGPGGLGWGGGDPTQGFVFHGGVGGLRWPRMNSNASTSRAEAIIPGIGNNVEPSE